jgi:hypothetical protein
VAVLEEVAATSTKLGTVRYTGGRARAAPAALSASPTPAPLRQSVVQVSLPSR